MPVHVTRADLVARSAGSGLPYLDAIAKRHGATRVYAALVTVPPGGRTVPHYHLRVETVIFQTKGVVRTRYGPHLEHSVVTGPGDFLFIPPGEIHQAINEGDEPAEAVVFRDDEVEEVVEVSASQGKA